MPTNSSHRRNGTRRQRLPSPTHRTRPRHRRPAHETDRTLLRHRRKTNDRRARNRIGSNSAPTHWRSAVHDHVRHSARRRNQAHRFAPERRHYRSESGRGNVSTAIGQGQVLPRRRQRYGMDCRGASPTRAVAPEGDGSRREKRQRHSSRSLRRSGRFVPNHSCGCVILLSLSHSQCVCSTDAPLCAAQENRPTKSRTTSSNRRHRTQNQLRTPSRPSRL